MKNSKKILSLALTLAMILSAVFCTGVVANAEDTLVPTANDVTKVTFSTTEADMDWSLVGPNLIPDSTVSEFNADGTYKNYYTAETYDAASQNSILNPNAWWSSTTEANMGYNNGGNSWYKGIGALASGTTLEESHTDDGTGALVCTTTGSYNVRMLPMNATTANSYYLLSFWIKTTGGSNVTMHFRAAGDNPIKDNVSVATTTGWTRVMYIVSVTTRGLNKVSVVFDNSQDIYIDEVELYKLDGQYAQDCLAAGKLLNGKEGDADLITTSTFYDVYSSGKQYNDIDFTAFGTNLFSDPTVKEFDENGVYKDNIGFAKKPTNSAFNSWIMKARGATLNDPALSRTNDGSGVLKLTSKTQHLIVLPNLEAKSAYLVTFWVKDASDAATPISDHTIYAHNHSGGQTYVESKYNASNFGERGEWHRVSYIYTRAATAQANSGIVIYNAAAPLYIDDFAMYKLDPKYASQCITAGALLSENDFLAQTRPSMTTGAICLSEEDTKLFNYDSVGENLIPDSTVAQFDENGNYKEYYADDTSANGGAVVNANAWWNRAALWNYHKMVLDKSWTGAVYYSSFGYRNYIESDPKYSRTKDGSGALHVKDDDAGNGRASIPLPKLQKKNYYLFTAWVKRDINYDRDFSSQMLNSSGNGYGGSTATTITLTSDNWYKVSYIIRTGDSDVVNTMIFLDLGGKSYFVDDISLYKLDFEYGEKSYNAGAMANNIEAPKKDAETLTVETAKSTVDATVADGYFVPYGAFATQDNKMAVKLGNGRFYVENAGDYSYTQFKYPTGIVGTYGASAKTDADDTKTGIQFGSLITDNLSIDKDGAQGTLVFRDTDKGTFEEFRATFPTKTRKELAAEIYAKLKAAEEASGINLANRAVTLNNGGKSVVVIYVPRTTYMWKNSANTELQYAVRVHSIATNYGDVNYTAIGYVTKDGKLEFSNEIKDGVYNELIPAAN